MSIEMETANLIAHRERIAAIRAEHGGEGIHPDHYAFRMALRDAVLAAMDSCADEHGMTRPLDRDLPALFRTLDPLAESLWLRRMGL
jgi:hypothetical protein